VHLPSAHTPNSLLPVGLAVAWFLIPLGPARAADEEVRRNILQIATDACATNLATLTVPQQQDMTQMENELAGKLSDDPVGCLSGAFVSLLSQGANLKATTALAAWAVKKFPDEAPLLNNFGYALFLLKDYDRAVTLLEQAVVLDGRSAEYATNLGNAYLDMGRLALAKKSFDAALKIDPDHDCAWVGLSCYYMKTGDFKAAIGILSKRRFGGFMQRNREKMQAVLDAAAPSEKCEWVLDDDSLDAMAQKIAKIAQTRPLSVKPLIEPVAPDLAQKIAAEMDNPPATIEAPAQPYVIDYSSAREHFVTVAAYRDVAPMPGVEPVLTPAQKRLQSMSKQELKELGQRYRANAQKALAQAKGMKMDPKDPASIQKVLEVLQTLKDPEGILPSANQQIFQGKPGASPVGAAIMPVQDTPGLVTSSNYQNYAKNKMNFQKFCDKIIATLIASGNEIGTAFRNDMDDLKLRQEKERESDHGPELGVRQRQQRNGLRDAYVQKFGSELNALYLKHIKPAIEKMERCDAVFIKNFNDPALKRTEAAAMRTQLDRLLGAVAMATAPVDDYEPETTEAAAQIQRQIAAVKAGAVHKGEPIAPLKQYDVERKTILDWIYKDAKFSASISAAKITFQNNELTLAMSDLAHQQTMAVGVNLVDQTVSLTDTKGVEFNIAVGAGTSDGMKVAATAGVAKMDAGTKTTLYFDDNLNVFDAKVTSTKAVDALTGSIKVGDSDSGLGVKGTLTTSVAEGLSGIHGAVEASYEKGLAAGQATLQEDSVGVQAGVQAKEGGLTGSAAGGLSVDAKGNVYAEGAVKATFDQEMGSTADPDKKKQKLKVTIFSNNYKQKIN
jgi:Tfp pilus assembly protein PilF